MCQVCLLGCPTLIHMGQRSEVNFFHLQRLMLWGREPTETAMVKAKWCSVSAVAELFLSSSPFSLMVKRWFSLARELAWSRCALLSFPSIHLRVSLVSFFHWSIWVLFHCDDDLFSGFQLLVSPCVLDMLALCKKAAC